MAQKTRKKIARRKRTRRQIKKITVTDTGKELVATMPGLGFLTISAGADLKLIRRLIKKRQKIGREIGKIIAAKGGFAFTAGSDSADEETC